MNIFEVIQKGQQDHIDHIKKSLAPTFDEIKDEIIKGKAAQLGEERTWGGVAYVKTGAGWVPKKKAGGQKTGEQESGEKKEGQPEEKKEISKEELLEHAKSASEGALQNAVKTAKDPSIREAAHRELERRKNEEATETFKAPDGTTLKKEEGEPDIKGMMKEGYHAADNKKPEGEKKEGDDKHNAKMKELSSLLTGDKPQPFIDAWKSATPAEQKAFFDTAYQLASTGGDPGWMKFFKVKQKIDEQQAKDQKDFEVGKKISLGKDSMGKMQHGVVQKHENYKVTVKMDGGGTVTLSPQELRDSAKESLADNNEVKEVKRVNEKWRQVLKDAGWSDERIKTAEESLAQEKGEGGEKKGHEAVLEKHKDTVVAEGGEKKKEIKDVTTGNKKADDLIDKFIESMKSDVKPGTIDQLKKELSEAVKLDYEGSKLDKMTKQDLSEIFDGSIGQDNEKYFNIEDDEDDEPKKGEEVKDADLDGSVWTDNEGGHAKVEKRGDGFYVDAGDFDIEAKSADELREKLKRNGFTKHVGTESR